MQIDCFFVFLSLVVGPGMSVWKEDSDRSLQVKWELATIVLKELIE